MINLTFCVSNLTQISPAIYKLVLFIQTVDRVPFIRRTILKRKEGKGKKKQFQGNTSDEFAKKRSTCTAQINYSRGIITFAERRNIFHRANFHRDSTNRTGVNCVK